ncbi:aryl-alcohol dehydrogenase-like predicted oxidoreductase [Halanaerobium saccharolyticum]|uniref:Aryl-alcohol dehydrogenase-like predicted oxidoreductase n=1 Tax=Halanaerobium saccharolyticum TaxID=43595 RepID=A0A4V3G5Z5_9FIRM|nr:aldo/keto reductase [Halanaerobium saccharolyticum]RAK11698.1 aryl-alcohol dehydrogenase-like predicted oxidoreductase [Halanaerobium saccharolyticum]TDW07539.1 aryl-alcohol dehydrogenase-like predicted oxidoreductase [Halanaerobium saccharolyticum]TDX64460.1 aryl-alcohol dehydrogenase-like predicted oxidoreductase [Halanaerobium saccharolyticum]
MEYKTIGKTGVEVSPLCFGTMSFGGIADENMSRKMFKEARDRGINFFDSADVYNEGRSEELLGKFMQEHKCRDQLVITSKVFGKTAEDVNAKGLSRRHIKLGVEASLRRLKTDWIDFYFVHSFDSKTDMLQTLKAMDDLVKEGKILYPAVSNWAAWQIEMALGISRQESLARFELIQPMYNLVKRQAEVEILPMAVAENMGVISYSPLGGGLLTGKYGKDKRPDKGRLVEREDYATRYGLKQYYQIAEDFSNHARERGVDPASLAVAWVESNPAITAPIIGARNLEQLKGSLGALDIEMTEEWRKEITELSITPPPATDRLEEQKNINYF